MIFNVNFLIFVGVVILSFIILNFITKNAVKLKLIDKPNHRSSHSEPTPRGGGLIIMIGLIAGLIVFWLTGQIDFSPVQFIAYLSVILSMTALGVISDIVYIPIVLRLLCQFFIAAIAVFLLPVADLLVLGPLSLNGIWLALIFIVWIVANVNFFNFMDGLDGYAGFQTLIVCCLLLYLGYTTGSALIVSTVSIIIISLIIFLNSNLKSKIFLGDVGSYTLSFILILLSLFHPSFIIPVILAFSWFLFDATITLLRRIISGQAWFQSHRTHFYQRANIIGYSHQQISFTFLIFYLIFAGLGAAYFHTPNPMLIFLSVLICCCIACFIKTKEKQLLSNKISSN
ncbi:TPA: hypothetical protein DF272_03370 [Candidatus Falkowbacteria bacterium]|nr:hypothetical protein [Candidatus Falkowbacteria bacterium]